MIDLLAQLKGVARGGDGWTAVAFIETMDGEGPQGAKGVGEAPAICVAAAVGNAIYNATGVRITALPFTPENVYRALHSNWQSPTWIEAA